MALDARETELETTSDPGGIPTTARAGPPGRRPWRHPARGWPGGPASGSHAPDAADQRLLRRTRWRLLAWSAGSTLIALVVLGSAIYVAVAQSLATASVDQLRDRAAQLEAKALNGPALIGLDGAGGTFGVALDPGRPGLVFGGESSGTLGIVLAMGPDAGATGGSGSVSLGSGSPITDVTLPSIGLATSIDGLRPAALQAARTGQETTIVTSLDGAPIRVLSMPLTRGGATYVVQVVGDQTTEQRTLQVLLVVLGAGGMLILVLALGVGWVYSGRALIPIRESLRHQRDFAADASHELRTPLAILRASVDQLQRQPQAPVASVGSALGTIDAEVGRVTALVDQLLLLARADSGSLEIDRAPMDLSDAAVEASGDLAPLARGAGVQVGLELQPVTVDGDAARLRQLVGLLLDNAIRHARAGGRVTIRTVGVAGGAVLVVEDDGDGIAADDLPRIFDRFYRASDAPSGGTGLGLAIARWIVERHGGEIAAENLPERGARFTVRLPAA